MKILDADKVIALLEKMKKFLPGKNGILPTKCLSKENIDWTIQALQANTIDLDPTPDDPVICEFCTGKTGKGLEVGRDYPIQPCANGDLGVRAQYMDHGIILYVDRHTASGYFDINYCPICGRKINKEG